jgi:hypothetical protein
MGSSAATESSGILPRRPEVALAAFVVVTGTLNAFTFQASQDTTPEWLIAIIVGAWIMEPMAYGVWAALGRGHAFVRLPIVTLCLLLSLAALAIDRASIAEVERYEFITIVVAAVAVYSLTAGLLLAVRWSSGLRMHKLQSGATDSHRVQFSVGYLLAVTTITAIVLALVIGLTFREPERQWISFGPGFIIQLLSFGAAFCFVALWPVLAAALVALRPVRSRRAMWLIASGWLIVIVILSTVWAWGFEWSWSYPLYILLIQVGGAAVAALGVMMAQCAGYQLSLETPASP